MFQHLPVAEGDLWALAIAPLAVRSIPGLAEAFAKVVPSNYVAIDLNEDGFSAVFITCPCGETHVCEVGTTIVTECARAFYWFGGEVRACALDDSEDLNLD